MGVRVGLYYISKKTHNQYKDLTLEEINESPTLWSDFHKHSMCDLLDCDLTKIESICQPLFNKIPKDAYDEVTFLQISKTDFEKIIEYYKTLIIEGCNKKKLSNYQFNSYFDGGSLFRDEYRETVKIIRENQLEAQHAPHEWEKNHHIDVNPKNKWLVSNSFRIDYFIFDLIHIYKTFNWNKNVMLLIIN